MTTLYQKVFYSGYSKILRFRGRKRCGIQRGVLIAKTDHIGDFIIGIEAIRMIFEYVKSEFPDEERVLLVRKNVAPIARCELPALKIVEMPELSTRYPIAMFQARRAATSTALSGRWRKFISFRHHPTLLEDILFDTLQSEKSYGLGGSELDAKTWPNQLRKVKYDMTALYPNLNECAGVPREIEANRRLLNLVGIKSDNYLPKLASFNVNNGRTLLICPHASATIRCYPLEKLIRALELCTLPTGWRFIICVERSKLSDARRIADSLASRSVLVEITTPHDTLEFCRSIAAAGAIFSMDSAAAHIACALRKPGVFVLGGGHYGSFGPWTSASGQIWLTNHLDCFNCNWLCTRTSPECITNVAPSEIGRHITNVCGYKI
jgi:ADP-heptose:LPS heptosyltransferase